MAFAVRHHAMVSYDGLISLADRVRYCEANNIPGDLVECGTWKGGCLGVMAQANMRFGMRRRMLHGFDSFEGIPMPRSDKDDLAWAIDQLHLYANALDGRLSRTGHLEAEQLFSIGTSRQARLSPRHGTAARRVVPTVPVAAATIKQIAILRLDGDLYESYKIPLQHLFDAVSPGGFVVIDDWILKGCREAVTEFLADRKLAPYLSHVDYSIRYLRR
jgi:O-methyltransferase